VYKYGIRHHHFKKLKRNIC